MSEIVSSSLKTTVKGTTLAFLGIVATNILGFAIKFILARNVTTEELGIYSLALAVAGIVSLVATLGMQDGASRFVSIYNSQGRQDAADSITSYALRTGLLASAISLILLYCLSGIIAKHVFYSPVLSTPFKIISFYIPFSTLSLLLSSVLRGHGVIKAKIYYLDIGQPLFFLILICAVFYFKLPFVFVMHAFLGSMVLACIAIWSYGASKIRWPSLFIKSAPQRKELLRFSLPLVYVSVMGLALAWADTLILGRYTTPSDVGIYNISITFARLLNIPAGALGFVFLPIAGGLYAKNHISELKRINFILTKWSFSVVLPLFCILFFFPEITISFLFGDRFTAASQPLRILSVGFLLNAFLCTNGILMMVLDLTKGFMKISIFGAFIDIALNYFMVKHLKLATMGAAISTTISYCIINFLISMTVYRKSGIHPISLKYAIPFVCSTVMAMLVYFTAKSLPLYYWMLPVYLALFAGGYVSLILVAKGLDKEDIFMLDTIFEKTGLKADRIRKFISKFV